MADQAQASAAEEEEEVQPFRLPPFDPSDGAVPYLHTGYLPRSPYPIVHLKRSRSSRS